MNEEVNVEHLAHQFAAYVKVDKRKEMQALDEAIKDILTCLEELESSINMLQAEREKFVTSVRPSFNDLSQRIDKLDEMSKIEVEALKTVVSDAELNLTSRRKTEEYA